MPKHAALELANTSKIRSHRSRSRADSSQQSGRVLLGTSQSVEAVQQLKIIAAESGTTMQALVAEGLNCVFVKHGRQKVAKP